MKTLKSLVLIASGLFIGSNSFAQAAPQGMIEDPATWKYEVKKKSATEYQVIFHLDLKTGWHIWALKPGGDGYEIAPSFTFEANPKVKVKGNTTEKGKAITTKMAGIEGKITYLSGKIDYTQNITVTGNTTVKGKHTYQVCNDQMCLPPKDKEFSLDIK
jgi:hypothetical protein